MAEKHGVNNGKTITLSFVRFKSTNPQPGYPIVYLAGGPGGSGIDAARGKRFPLFMALRKVADVIALDQRGTGASNAIRPCSYKPFPLEEPRTRSTTIAYFKTAEKHCVAAWQKQGIDLAAYNTREIALDLNTLRKALGVKKLNLWGISYGSTVALGALKLIPKHIDRVVLASPVATYQMVRLPERTQAFLERVDALIKASPKYAAVYPDLLGTMKTVLDSLARKPAKVTLKDTPDANPVTLRVGSFAVKGFTKSLLKDPSRLRSLPADYYALAARFQAVWQPSYSSLTEPEVFTGMPLAVRATSCLSPARAKLVERQAKRTLLGNVLNFDTMLVRIRIANVTPLHGDFCKPVNSDVPTLILTGTLDGRTYPAGHAEILQGLSNGNEVVIENAGHDLFMSSPKVTVDIVEFLNHQPVKYSTIQVPPPDFVVPAPSK
ncbi:MAG TPA: alpha/beta hydrolase [Gammaproteobacteria bacterium]|nr:alpha/beta hydrolase [Gammaproteobacteria bacterium]